MSPLLSMSRGTSFPSLFIPSLFPILIWSQEKRIRTQTFWLIVPVCLIAILITTAIICFECWLFIWGKHITHIYLIQSSLASYEVDIVSLISHLLIQQILIVPITKTKWFAWGLIVSNSWVRIKIWLCLIYSLHPHSHPSTHHISIHPLVHLFISPLPFI
jgi:hypothetical protein